MSTTNEHEDKYVRVDRFAVALGVILLLTGILLVRRYGDATRSFGARLGEEIGLACLIVGLIDFVFFTGVRRLKLYLTRDLRELETKTRSHIDKMDRFLHQVDGFTRSAQDLLHREQVETALADIKDELEMIHRAVDPDYRELVAQSDAKGDETHGLQTDAHEHDGPLK